MPRRLRLRRPPPPPRLAGTRARRTASAACPAAEGPLRQVARRAGGLGYRGIKGMQDSWHRVSAGGWAVRMPAASFPPRVARRPVVTVTAGIKVQQDGSAACQATNDCSAAMETR
jgi:hypothetical protein